MHNRGIIGVILACAILGTGCQSTQSIAQDTGIVSEAAKAFIGKDIELTLPTSPNFPGEMSAMQTLIARHQDRVQALQAVLTAREDHVNVVTMLANGPRIMEVDWTAQDMLETRSSFAPEALSGLNMLADIYLVFWPQKAVQTALPEGVYVNQEAGLRQIYNDTRQIVEIRYYTKDERGRDHYVLTNFDLGYSLTIYSDTMTAK